MRWGLILAAALLSVYGAAVAAPPKTGSGTIKTLPGAKGAPQLSTGYPQVNITACITDMRYHIYQNLHSVTGFAKSADGRTHSFYVGADGASMIVGNPDGTYVPLFSGESAPYAPSAEPGVVQFLMRAAETGAWVRFDLEASPNIGQKVDQVQRTFYKTTGDCRDSL
ncbi:MAG TPA: hypothetical protein VNH64_03990 [Parvularculaceae bacterium]|nr:hypothetical protein [Parvularculaceae bacterium]